MSAVMTRPTRSQWIVLWVGALWTLLSLAIADDYVVRAVIAGAVLTALLFWQFSPRKGDTATDSIAGQSSHSTPPRQNVNLADFFGSLLAIQFGGEYFGLKDADLVALTTGLPPHLRQPAALWINIYSCWLFRLAIKATYGADVAAAATEAARQQLAGTVTGAHVHEMVLGFEVLDRATASIGQRIGDFVADLPKEIGAIELPFEAPAAWGFLALSAESPYRGDKEFPDGVDLELAACLEKAKKEVLPAVRFLIQFEGPVRGTPEQAVRAFVDAVARADADVTDASGDQTSELAWNADPGPAERRLRRQYRNPLFPPDRRTATPAQIELAQRQDYQALRALAERFKKTLEKVMSMPDIVEMDRCKETLDGLQDLKVECVVCSQHAAIELQEQIESAEAIVVSAMRTSLTSKEAVTAYDAWRDKVREQEAFLLNPIVAEVSKLPPEGIVPTVCSLEPGEIALYVRAVGSDDAMRQLRAACAESFAAAIGDGFDSAIASARLRALGAIV